MTARDRADDLTKDGMLKGIEQAAAFVIFLSAGVLMRPYCQMEIRQAIVLEKPIVLLHEVSCCPWSRSRLLELDHSTTVERRAFWCF